MLITKLLRIEEHIADTISEMAEKLSEKEYTSFSALARKLIRVGLTYLEVAEVKEKRIVSIPKCHFSKCFKDGYSTEDRRNDSEIENIMAALNVMHTTIEDDCKKNHLMIEWRTTDNKGEYFAVGVLGQLDELKPGDEIILGMTNAYKLVVMPKQ